MPQTPERKYLSTDPRAGLVQPPPQTERVYLSTDPNQAAAVPDGQEPPAALGAVDRFLSEFGPRVNPLNMLRGFVSEANRSANTYRSIPSRMRAGDAAGVEDALISGVPILGAEYNRIKNLWAADTGSGAADTVLKAIESIPIIGEPMMAMGSHVNQGDYAGAAGVSLSLPAQALMTEGAGAAMRVAGRSTTAAGRAGTSAVIRPSITEDARLLTGQGPWAPARPTIAQRVTGSGPKPWQAADQAIVDTAVSERTLPGFLDTRTNPAESAMMASEQRVRAGLAQVGANGQPLGDLDFPVHAATRGGPNLIGSGPVRETWEGVRSLTPRARDIAADAARPHVQAVLGDIDRTLVEKADQVAAARPLYGASGSGPSTYGPRMARALDQGTRETLERSLRAEGSPAAIAAADELARQQRLAPVAQVGEDMRPAIAHEGVPTMDVRAKIGVVNRALGPASRAALNAGEGLERAGTAIGADRVTALRPRALAQIPLDELVRQAIIQQLQAKGMDQAVSSHGGGR